MTKRTLFHGIAWVALAVAAFLPGSALAAVTGITGPSDVRYNYTAVFTATGSAAVDYHWKFTPGDTNGITVLNSARITWLADLYPTDDYDPAVVLMTVKDLLEQTEYSRNINVYRPVSIFYKDLIPKYVLPGKHTRSEHGVDKINGTGGRYGTYQWIFTGPAWATFFYAGNNKVANFTGPTTGRYAGEYTVTLQDGLPGVDSVKIWVPVRIEEGPVIVAEGGAPIFYHITGMPDGINYTPRLMTGTDSSATEVTGDVQYGNITAQIGPSVGGVYTLTYTPPANASTFNKFYIICEPDQALNFPAYGNIYRPLPFGPMIVRDTRNFSGQLLDTNTRLPIVGAKVSLYAPAPYRGFTTTNALGEFFFGPLPSANMYAFSISAPGYTNGKVSSQYLAENVPGNAQISVDPASAAFVSGNVRRPDGSLLGPNEDAVVGLVRKYWDGTVPRVELLGELSIVGSSYYLSLAAVPPNPPQAGVHDYVLMAYTEGLYTEYVLPDGTNFPYAGVDLTLSNTYKGVVIGTIPYMNDGIPVPITGGLRVAGVNTKKDLVTGDLIGQFPAGFVEIRPAGIEIDELTGAPLGANLIGDITDNQNGDDIGRSTFAYAVPSITFVDVRDDNMEGNNELVGDRWYRVKMPLDLTVINKGSLEQGLMWVRSSVGNVLDLKSCESSHIAAGNIYAIDYLGDGRTGSVYFDSGARGKWFAVGGQCDEGIDNEGGYDFAPFERYEIFGCFVSTVMAESGGRTGGSGLLAAALLLAGLLFTRRN